MLTTRTTHAGLVVAEQSADEAGVSRALKLLDDRLVLQKHPGPVEGGWVYRVFRLVSDDQPPEIVCTWADERGNPLPLTSGIVDHVDRLRVDARNKGIDADEHNRRHLERVRDLGRDLSDAVVEDHRAYVERGRHSVSMSGRRRRNRSPR